MAEGDDGNASEERRMRSWESTRRVLDCAASRGITQAGSFLKFHWWPAAWPRAAMYALAAGRRAAIFMISRAS